MFVTVVFFMSVPFWISACAPTHLCLLGFQESLPIRYSFVDDDMIHLSNQTGIESTFMYVDMFKRIQDNQELLHLYPTPDYYSGHDFCLALRASFSARSLHSIYLSTYMLFGQTVQQRNRVTLSEKDCSSQS